MDVDLPEVHARGARRHARRSWPAWATTSGAIASDCEDWTVRELVNHIVTGNYWAAELGAGQTIEEVGDRLDGDVLGDDPLAAYDDSALRGGGGVPCARRDGGAVRGVVRAGARRGLLRPPVHRRADPRLGRRQRRPGRTPRSTPRSSRRASRWSSPSSTCSSAAACSGRRLDVPDDAEPQTQLLAVLGRRG